MSTAFVAGSYVVYHFCTVIAWGFQGPRGIFNWVNRPGRTYRVWIVLVQSFHADFPGAGCIGQLNSDSLVLRNDGRMLP